MRRRAVVYTLAVKRPAFVLALVVACLTAHAEPDIDLTIRRLQTAFKASADCFPIAMTEHWDLGTLREPGVKVEVIHSPSCLTFATSGGPKETRKKIDLTMVMAGWSITGHEWTPIQVSDKISSSWRVFGYFEGVEEGDKAFVVMLHVSEGLAFLELAAFRATLEDTKGGEQ